MAATMLLTLAGIPGESLDAIHPNSIEIDSFTWGVDQNVGSAARSDSTSTKPSFRSLTVTKRFDSTSPVLMQKCALGEALVDAVLTIRAPGASSDHITIRLGDVRIERQGTSGSDGESVEELALVYSTIVMTSARQHPDGSEDTTVTRGWNVAENTLTT